MDARADRRGSEQLPLTLDKHSYALGAEPVSSEPDEIQGLLRVYKVRPIALTLTDVRGTKAALSVPYRAENLAVLQEWGLDCRSAGEPKNPPEKSFLVRVTDGGELLSKGKLEVWREGDTLCFSGATETFTRARTTCTAACRCRQSGFTVCAAACARKRAYPAAA